MIIFFMNEHYPTLLQMAPWNKTYPVTWIDGWNIFRGPKVGELAPDEFVVLRTNEPRQSLHTLIDRSFNEHPDQQFFVIIFDGSYHGDTMQTSKTVIDELEKRYSGQIDVILVTNYYDTAQYDVIDNIVGDMEWMCARKYGATWQSIYVVDHEKKVVRKSCGFMIQELDLYLKSQQKSV